jgi:hypothetical protein
MRARCSASRAYDAVTSLVRSVVRTASVSVILNVLAVVTRPSRVRRFDRRNVISRPPGTRLSDAFSMSPRDAAPRGQNRVWRSVGDAAAKKSGSAPNFFWGASIGCEWIAKPKIGIRRAAFQTIRTLRRDTPVGQQGCPRECRTGSGCVAIASWRRRARRWFGAVPRASCGGPAVPGCIFRNTRVSRPFRAYDGAGLDRVQIPFRIVVHLVARHRSTGGDVQDIPSKLMDVHRTGVMTE